MVRSSHFCDTNAGLMASVAGNLPLVSHLPGETPCGVNLIRKRAILAAPSGQTDVLIRCFLEMPYWPGAPKAIRTAEGSVRRHYPGVSRSLQRVQNMSSAQIFGTYREHSV
ncbi:MAG TPA: hypothetical protein VE079_08040 [Ensifer sp.]|nr:hypothetical protein [Ensifer sp.]